MPDRPKSIQPPPPEPEPPLGRNPGSREPTWENDRALRYTWSRPFEDRDQVDALEQIAYWCLQYAREAGRWGTRSTHGDVAAAAEDLDSLRVYLLMVAESIEESVNEEDERRLGDRSKAWAGRLGSLVREMRREIEEAPEAPSSVALTRARGALEAMESAQEQLLAAFGPGIPAELRGPVGAALGRVAEAVPILRSVVPAEPEGDGE